MIAVIIPCSGDKLDHAAPARDLYTGTMFRHTLAAAEKTATDARADGENAIVLVLSARYGLVTLDRVLDPYEQRMDQPGAIPAIEVARQALALGIDWGDEVYAFLPAAYFKVLHEALWAIDVYPQPVYEAAPGIGYQRGVNANVVAH